ncbi:MAG: hypothetical protein [Bacteriophage sp.]|nr:MAG: hypothetical protein [Bacteriophage sp.]
MYIINLTVMQQNSKDELCEVENFSFNVEKNFEKEFVSRNIILNHFKGLVDAEIVASISQALEENNWIFDFDNKDSLNHKLRNIESNLVAILCSHKDDIIEVNEKIMCVSTANGNMFSIIVKVIIPISVENFYNIEAHITPISKYANIRIPYFLSIGSALNEINEHCNVDTIGSYYVILKNSKIILTLNNTQKYKEYFVDPKTLKLTK